MIWNGRLPTRFAYSWETPHDKVNPPWMVLHSSSESQTSTGSLLFFVEQTAVALYSLRIIARSIWVDIEVEIID